VQPPWPALPHDRSIVPSVLLMIVKKLFDRDLATIVYESLAARAATEPTPGGMLLSIGRFVLMIVAFEVQLE
jgi:hypothetical protein